MKCVSGKGGGLKGGSFTLIGWFLKFLSNDKIGVVCVETEGGNGCSLFLWTVFLFSSLQENLVS